MERARTSSIVVAIGAGVALGAAALVALEAARVAGARAAGGRARWPSVYDGGHDGGAAPGPAQRALAGHLRAAPASASHLAAAPTRAPRPMPSAAARGPRDRFAEDPSVAAACPPDMALVEGDFCPALPYRCARPGEEQGFGCAAYERGQRCLDPVDHRRFCVDRHEWPNRVGELPRVYVDWHEARALCAGVGKRLCRRSEWTLACEGPKRLPYPWGFVRSPSPCNVDRAAIQPDIPALIGDATREEELARLWQADPIGSHPDCISAYGVYDLSGNVDEWTDNHADDPGAHPSTLNGGYWGPVRNTCRLATGTHGPDFKFYQVGFRCCADTIDGVTTPPPRPWVDRERREAVYD